MFNKTTTLLLFCLLLTLTLFAEKVIINPRNTSPVTYTVTDATDDYTIVEIQLNNYTREAIDIKGEKYLNIGIESAGVTLEKGFPSLPLLAKSLIIGHDSQMHLEVLKANYTEFTGQIAPSKGNLYRNVNPADVPYTFDDIYTKDAFYPSEIARLIDPYVMRELRGIAFQILPVSVNPAQQTIRLYHHVTIKVYTDGRSTDESILPGPPTIITRDFIEIYKHHFINYDYYKTRYNSITENGTLLVICYPDFMDAMEPYVNWKIQKGIQADLMPSDMIPSATGTPTADEIKAFITSYYNALPATAFIQLVGDYPQVPSIMYWGGPQGNLNHDENGPSDSRFAMIVGGANDYYPDILIGRFSASTIANVTTQVARTIQYERDLTTSADWIPGAIGIASNEGQGIGHNGGESDRNHIINIRDLLLQYGYNPVDEIYQGLAGSSATNLSAAINAGRSYINYAGHGDTTYWNSPYYTNSTVNALTNTGMLPFIVSVACNNGKFAASSTCFAETWMRATDNTGQAKGAIATFMCSILQAWAPPMTTQDVVSQLLTSENKHTVGGLVYNAQSAMLDQYNNSSGREVMQTWVLFGDVSLVLRTNTPEELAINPPSLPLGATSYSLYIPGVPDAQVCISNPEDNYVIATDFTNESGQVTLDVSSIANDATPVCLTVTWFNGVSFTTMLSRGGGIPYSQNFDSGLSLSAINWAGNLNTYSGIKAASGVGGTNGLTMNVYGSSATQYASAPALTGVTSQTKLTFDYRLVGYTTNWNNPLSAKTLEAEDKVFVEISTTGTSGAYTVVKEINSTNHTPSTEFSHLEIPLSAYTNQSITARFRAVRGSGDWIAVFDNVFIGTPNADSDDALPLVLTALGGNYPNPFNPSTTIMFDTARSGHVTIDIYNVKGQHIKEVVSDSFSAGKHSVVWNGDDATGRSVGSGVYFYRMTMDSFSSTRKMLLIK